MERRCHRVKARPGKQNHHVSGVSLSTRSCVIVGEGRAIKPQKGELEDKPTSPAGFPVALTGGRLRWLRACPEGTSWTLREALQRQDPGGATHRGGSPASACRTHLHTGDSRAFCTKCKTKGEACTDEQNKLPEGRLRTEKIWRKFPAFLAFPLKQVTVTAARDNGYLDRNPLFLV